MWIDLSNPFWLEELKKNTKEPWQKSILSFFTQWYNQESYLYIETSGTTKKARKIKVAKEKLIESAKMTIAFFSLKEKMSFLLALSINYIASKMLLVRAILLKGKIYCLKPSSYPLKSINFLFDFASMVPLQVENSLDKLNHITYLLIGGASISKKLEEKLQSITSPHIYHSYGMSETLSHIALRKVNGPDKTDYFKVLADIEIKKDKRGCLTIYYPKLYPNKIKTNDLVELISPSTFKWLGRYDHVINSGGIKMIPEEWEKKLNDFIPIPFFISALKDESLGEKIILILQGKPLPIKFPSHLFKGDNRFYKPKSLYFIDAFDQTSSGKIKRKETLKKINLNEAFHL